MTQPSIDNDRLASDISRAVGVLVHVVRRADAAPIQEDGWHPYVSENDVRVEMVEDQRYRFVAAAVLDRLALIAFDWATGDWSPRRYVAVIAIDPTSPVVGHACLEELQRMFATPTWPWVGGPSVGGRQIVVAERESYR